MRVLADDAVVVNRGTRIHDDVVADHRIRLHDRAAKTTVPRPSFAEA